MPQRIITDIDKQIAQANERLKAGRIGVTIDRLGNRLYLRALLPPKPGVYQAKKKNQRIATGLYANGDGVRQVEGEARKVGGLLACREFSWEPYLKRTEVDDYLLRVRDWILQFEKDYFERRNRNHKSETTWKGDYLKVFKLLPQDELLTPELMRQQTLKTEPDTKTRKRTCMVLGALAKFTGIDFDSKALAGKYSPGRVQPRTLPSDETIVEWFFQIQNPSWRWVYGILATYGLRNHEVFRLDLQQLQSGSVVISVLEGKTGARRVWPCYPEWFDQFSLQDVHLPPIELNRSNSAVGSSATQYFAKIGLPFTLYSMRHCWAVRTIEFGLDVSLAAQQMGHSVQVHTNCYHHWISDLHHQRAFELLMMRPERPRPPIN